MYSISSSTFSYVVAAFLIVVSCSCSSHRASSYDFSDTSSASLAQSMAMSGEGSREFGFDSIVVVGDFRSSLWQSICREVYGSSACSVPSGQSMEWKLLPSSSVSSQSRSQQGCNNPDTARLGQSHRPVLGDAHGREMRIAIYGGRLSANERLSASSQAYGSLSDSCSLHKEEAEDVANTHSRIDFFVPLLICGLLLVVVIVVYRKYSR